MDRKQLALVYGLLSQALQEPDAQYMLRLRESVGQLPMTMWEDIEIPLASLVSATSDLIHLSPVQLHAEHARLFHSPERPGDMASGVPIWCELASLAQQLAGEPEPAEAASNVGAIGMSDRETRWLIWGQRLSMPACLPFYQACGRLLIALAQNPLIPPT